MGEEEDGGGDGSAKRLTRLRDVPPLLPLLLLLLPLAAV